MMFKQSFSPWGMSGCFLRRLVAYTRDCRSRTLELYSTYHVRHFPRNVGVFPVSSHGCPTTQCPTLASIPSSNHVFCFSHLIPVLADMYNLLDVYLHSVSLQNPDFFLSPNMVLTRSFPFMGRDLSGGLYARKLYEWLSEECMKAVTQSYWDCTRLSTYIYGCPSNGALR